jgi:hypothetical protein
VLRIAVGAYNDLRVIATMRDIEHTDDLNILARPDAPRAEDAGRHVVLNDRVAFALVARA